MPVFFVCAGLLGLLAVLLTLNVGRMRTRKKIFLGDGGDPEMIAAIRAHGNLVEFAPLCLLLIWLLHATSTATAPSPSCRVVLLVARVLHAGGMLGADPDGPHCWAPAARRSCWPSPRSCSSWPASLGQL